MDLDNHKNRVGVIQLGQFIRPELKDRVIDLAVEVDSLEALRLHPLYQEYARLSTMVDGLYPELPAQYWVDADEGDEDEDEGDGE